ncbi:SigE family RNA polymerase sigma factor [Actinospica acidithermotolerans]|uniref:SigE family RNA polymerase sigma factor n=1 Tax=Actinospica acidithermotolerans TaxID=2828514 RepID=UPI0027DB96DC|nr:SigE family RNA polymerase sigma factor [Actinospica acidithermotolerans]
MRKRDVDHDSEEDFADFYRTARDGCLRAVYAACGDRALAEDLTGEAFARAYASWGKVSRHPAPRAWVVRTALNTHVSWWRRRRREVAWDEALDPAQDAQPGERLDAQVTAALRALPRRQREVVALRIFLDLDTGTTARALGIAPGTVTAHLSRATAALRESLAPNREQEPVS